jgi:DHA2 family multidrug resistance protein-like MFS transporter
VDAPATEARRATRREWIGLSVLALACLLYVMDLTVLHLAVPQLSADLRPTSTELLWIIDIYGFMVAGALVTMGTLGDRIGRRRLLLIGAAAFGAVSVLAAFSTTPEMLIASRALLGLAGATIAPSTLSLIFHMFTDPRERSVAVAVWIGAFSAGSAVGPILGGLMLEVAWWGSVFLLALPVMGALLVLGPRVLPEYRDPDAGRLDVLSAAMSVIALLAVVFGVKQIAQDGVGPLPLTTVLVGLLAGVLWVRRQRRLLDPMIDVGLFRIPAFTAALGVNFLSIFVMVGYFLYVAQYLQLVVGLSPLDAGLWSLPSALAFVAASQLSPRVLHRVRPAIVIATGLVIAALGLLVVTRIGVDEGLLAVVIGSVAISIGMGPVFGLTTELVVGAAPPEKAGAASGVSETAAELGGALGIAALGSVGVAVYRSRMENGLPAGVPADASSAARDTLAAAMSVATDLPDPIGAGVLATAQSAFVTGVQLATGVAAALALVTAGIAAVALRGRAAPSQEFAAAGTPAADTPDGEGAPAAAASEPGRRTSDRDGAGCPTR